MAIFLGVCEVIFLEEKFDKFYADWVEERDRRRKENKFYERLLYGVVGSYVVFVILDLFFI